MFQLNDRLNIRQRLLAGFGLIGVLLLGFIIFSILSQRGIDELRHYAIKKVLPKADAYNEAYAAVLSLAVTTRNYVLGQTPELNRQLDQQFDQTQALLGKAMELDGLAGAERASMTAHSDTYFGLLNAFRELVSAGATPEVLRDAERRMAHARQELLGRLGVRQRRQAAERDAIAQQITERTAVLSRVELLVLVLVLLLCVHIAIQTIRAVHQPTLRLVRASRALAEGDYARALSLADASQARLWLEGTRPRNELQELTLAFTHMADQLRERERRLQAQNEELASQFEEIQAQYEEIQAQHEEIQAQNEEIQAQSEELQTQYDSLQIQSGELRETIETLTQSEARFRRVVESRLIGVYFWDEDGHISDANELFLEMLGYTRQDLEAGRLRIETITPPEFRSLDHETIEYVQRTGESTTYEKEFECADGRRLPVLICRLPVQQGVRRGFTFVMDITGWKGALERLELAQATAQIGTFEWRIPQDYLQWTAELARLYGRDVELAGRTFEQWLELVDPEDRARVRREVSLAVEHRTELETEFRVVLPDGSRRWLVERARVIADDAGQPLRMVGVNMDITERKNAEQAVHRLNLDLQLHINELRTLLEVIPIGIGIASDRECNTITMNPAFAEMLQLPAGSNGSATGEASVRDHFRITHHGVEVPAHELPMQRAARDGVVIKNLELDVLFHDGTTRPLLEFATPLLDEHGGVRGAVGAFIDITERRALEMDLKRQTQELERANRQKNEFLAMLAHELRNPLAAISNALYLMASTIQWTEQGERLHAMISRQTKHLVRLVDDLLDISRITRGKIELQLASVDLQAVVRHAIETCTSLIDNHGHAFQCELGDEPLPLVADAARLEQVVCNLLNNAIKYTEREGHIRLTLGREDDQAVLRVSDSGIGIPSGQIDQIFELFKQANHSTQHSQGGLGIGLTLVRALIELHEGTITAHSDGAGRGSEFIVRLPLRAQVGESCPLGTPAETSEERPLRVLIVEDNLDAAESLGQLLEIWGHEVAMAHSGTAALSEAARFGPNLILLDIGLPEMDGYEVARRLRADGFSDTVIVSLTGYGQSEDKEKSRLAGIDQHFTKPVDLDQLHVLIVEYAAQVAS